MAERKVLGKGLGALIPEIKEDAGTSERSLNCTSQEKYSIRIKLKSSPDLLKRKVLYNHFW